MNLWTDQPTNQLKFAWEIMGYPWKPGVDGWWMATEGIGDCSTVTVVVTDSVNLNGLPPVTTADLQLCFTHSLVQLHKSDHTPGTVKFPEISPDICSTPTPDALRVSSIHYCLQCYQYISLHQAYSTPSGGTLKHAFSKQLSVPPSGELQHLQFTYLCD